MSRPLAAHAHRSPVLYSLLWLLGLALCLRALVPAGYMPAPPGSGDARFALSLCSASGPLSFTRIALLADAQVSDDTDAAARPAGAGAATTPGLALTDVARGGAFSHPGDAPAAAVPDCPYGLAAHLALALPGAAGVAVWTPWPSSALAAVDRADRAAAAGTTAGPPLGSRAPPVWS